MVRRAPSVVDAMLLGTVLLWALNITVTKYVLRHGMRPLAYATTRYLAAIALFWCFTYARERSFRVELRDLPLVCVAGCLIFVNQLAFVNGVHDTTASSVALILGTTPIFVGVTAMVAGLERLQRSYWVAGLLSFVGVGLVAAGTGHVSGNLRGDALALLTAATWAAYSVSIAPLMRRYSPFRISALVLAIGWVPLAAAGAAQTIHQSFHFGARTWIGFAYAVVGPLFLTNILWFTSIDRVGPSRASLFANLQPFFAVMFAIALLGDRLTRLEVFGALAIFAGIALERARRRVVPEPDVP